MIKSVTTKCSAGRVVGWAELQLKCGSLEKVGNVFMNDDDSYELSISCIPMSGILELNLTDVTVMGSGPLLMCQDAKHCNVENVIGHVEFNGGSGKAVFAAYPAIDARYKFTLCHKNISII